MIALLICYAVALGVSLVFLRFHINLLRYPFYYSVPLILAVYMPLLVTFLLPIDYISHNSSAIPGFPISDSIILLFWKATYWSTFILTWLLLPILQEFYRSGNFYKLARLRYSLKRNAKFQAMILLVSLCAAVYLVLETGLSFSNLKSMIIALSHIYALVLALWLMAHGLFAIPKNRWLEGNLMQNLNHHYLKVPKLVDSIEDTKLSFREEVLQVMVLKENFTNPAVDENLRFRDWILDLYSMIPGDVIEAAGRQYTHSESRTISRSQISDSFMSSLTYNFQQHLYKLLAHNSEYDKLLGQITRLQTLIDAKSTANQVERLQLMQNLGGFLPPNIDYYVQCYGWPTTARLLSVALFGLSFLILESEFFHSTRLSLIDAMIFKFGLLKHSLVQAIFTASIFLWMLFCSLNSLARLKIFNMYHLVPHNSDPVSACFYASQIARLTIPLSYNFLTLFRSRESIFEEWYGKSIHLSGLFNSMNNWVPRLLLVPILLASFNIYEKIKSRLGITSDFYDWADFEDSEGLNSNVEDIEQQRSSRRSELAIVEAKRMVAVELSRRGKDTQSTLRDFNLRTEANRGPQFGDFLTTNISNRVDDTNFGNAGIPLYDNQEQTFFSKLGGALSGLRETVASRFGESRPRPSYHDEPSVFDNYDEDADENIVI